MTRAQRLVVSVAAVVIVSLQLGFGARGLTFSTLIRSARFFTRIPGFTFSFTSCRSGSKLSAGPVNTPEMEPLIRNSGVLMLPPRSRIWAMAASNSSSTDSV
ncbi:hypothetical protein NC796_15235 [Aliifodinibius sp. S!AR15-10]|nr:hypothetical protein [Aliifodinibius sp. S!AR15-10]MDR8392507.1 hypothetical protein [Aliifodinibius sp. S!AR15-10]